MCMTEFFVLFSGGNMSNLWFCPIFTDFTANFVYVQTYVSPKIKRCSEHIPFNEINSFPRGIRGIYVLYKKRPKLKTYNVFYIEMAKGKNGVWSRLRRHCSSKSKLCTHCSIFEVWNNIHDEKIEEMEGLFRYIYKDSTVCLFDIFLQQGGNGFPIQDSSKN